MKKSTTRHLGGFPLAQYIAHDKTAMLHHDLGQFVTNREVLAWTLGLGYSLSYRLSASALKHDTTYHWLRWLDRLQKSICSWYIGEPVERFHHDRGPRPTAEDDGVLRAQYGAVEIIANLGPRSRQEAGQTLAPHGFVAKAPGLIAGNFQTLGGIDFGDEGISFVSEAKDGKLDVWVFAPAEQEVAVLLPSQAAGTFELVFDDGTEVQTTVKGDFTCSAFPAPSNRRRSLLSSTSAPWPRGGNPLIGSHPFTAALVPDAYSMPKPILASWYDYPQYYDIAFRDETRPGGRLHRGGLPKVLPVSRAQPLELACGTGRLTVELAARGYRLTGLDLSKPSLDFAPPQPPRLHSVFEADMADFRLPGRSTPPIARSTAFVTCSPRLRPGNTLSALPKACVPAGSTSSASTCCLPTPRKSASNAGPNDKAALR